MGLNSISNNSSLMKSSMLMQHELKNISLRILRAILFEVICYKKV